MSQLDLMSKHSMPSTLDRLQSHPQGMMHQTIPVSVHAKAVRPIPLEDYDDAPHGEIDTTLSERGHTALVRNICQLSVPEKIVLARSANKRERSILIKDPSKEVALEVVHNRQITDGEIEMVARMSDVDDEVIAIIAEDREWTKQTKIARALVNNPKTPVHIACKLAHRIHTRDLRVLSTNRNIATAVRQVAKQLLTHRQRHVITRGRKH